jgi:hypothetical protein
MHIKDLNVTNVPLRTQDRIMVFINVINKFFQFGMLYKTVNLIVMYQLYNLCEKNSVL